jgi:hypothetical protein
MKKKSKARGNFLKEIMEEEVVVFQPSSREI